MNSIKGESRLQHVSLELVVMQGRKRVAVVGSGCAGLAAVWALQKTNHEVHLYEAGDRLGGHTNTCKFTHNGKSTSVDTGFIVMNSATYPNFIAFLREVGVPAVPTDMTFGVSRDQGVFEWAGTSLSTVFAQKSSIFSTRVWRMLLDVVRFNQFALDVLSHADESENDPFADENSGRSSEKSPRQESIGDYLQREGYSDAFRDDYLIPMTAAVWSTSPDKCSLDFPAITLIRFLWNHHLLSTISARPTWMTIKEGSQTYIDAIMKSFPASNVHLNTPVNSLFVRQDGKIIVQLKGLRTEIYDHVVLATHGDQAFDIVQKAATQEESTILSAFQTSKNVAVLHSDLSLMPKRRKTWASWNYLTTSGPQSINQVCLTYWMNLLQHIPETEFGHVLVTLNPLHPPDPDTVQGTYEYEHPLYNSAAIRAQKLLPRIQNSRGISYAGAWTKYGFHEDGWSSGLKAAMDHLGAELPFEFVDSTFSRGRRPTLTWQDYTVRILIHVVQITLLTLGIAFGYTSFGSKKTRSKFQ